MKRFFAVLLCVCLLAGCLPMAQAASQYFYEQFPDWHFDLTREPDRAMTQEEYLALTLAYSYWDKGVSGSTPRDAQGNLPSDWAASYIRSEAQKGTIDPSKLDYDAPATLAFIGEFLAHSKGIYSYDAVNLYEFRGAQELSAEQRLTLCAAVDCGLIAYSANLDVSATVPRKALESYLIPTGTVRPTAQTRQLSRGYRYSVAYYEDCYDDGAQAERQLAAFKRSSDCFNVAVFDAIYLQGEKTTMQLVGDQLDHEISGRDGENPQLEAIRLCKEQGILALGGVLNYYQDDVLKRLEDEQMMNLAVDELMQVVEKYGLDGLNLDIELTGNAYRALYGRLIAKTADALHQRGKLLMLSYGAAMTEQEEARTIYDYSAARQYADLVVLTTYDICNARDYNNGTSERGGLSYLLYHSRCLRYAAESIGAEKLLLGMASYGVQYNETDHAAGNISYDTVQALLAQTGASIQKTDEAWDDAYFTYSEGGKNYYVAFESEEGLQHRQALALNYGLGGVACFYVGSERESLFRLMKKSCTGLPYYDVSARDWFCPGIRFTFENSLMNGTSRTTFEPDATMTRAMLVTVLWRHEGSPAVGVNRFTDVPNGAYYTQAVAWAAEKGVVNGVSPDKFDPDGNVTRQQMAAILYRYAGTRGEDLSPSATLSDFPDAAQVQGYARAPMQWCVALGYIGGDRIDGVNYLSPSGFATRAQVATILMRYLQRS